MHGGVYAPPRPEEADVGEISAARALARFVVGLAASVLLFRALTLAEYGVLTLLTGLAATIGLYSDLGIERSLPRFIPEIERQGGRAGVARFLGRIIALNGEAGYQARMLPPGWHAGLWRWRYKVAKVPVVVVRPGEIALVNCSGEFEAASGGAMHFGPMGPVCDFLCGINPVTESTWGSVKALYR